MIRRARGRRVCVTILPPSPTAVACARAAEGEATAKEATAALQALPAVALPAMASALRPRWRDVAAAPPRAARARPGLPAPPLAPARAAAANWCLRRAAPPAAACRLRPADGLGPPPAARRPRVRCFAPPPRRSGRR